MRTTMHKWFWIWDFDKEERWLNEMAAKGKGLVHTGFCTYEFEDCAPGEYIYRLEMLDSTPGSAEGRQYIAFLEETGAEQIGSYLRWCYFRRKASLGPFDLFSDFDSRIRHLNRILFLLWVVLAMNFACCLPNLFGFGTDSPNFMIGLGNAVIMLLMALGVILISAKKSHLKKEREISES